MYFLRGEDLLKGERTLGGQTVVPRAGVPKSSAFCGILAPFSGTEMAGAQLLK